MAKVFVSHADEDAALAERVHGWLVDDGHQTFLDTDLRNGIVVGEEWQRRLHERLRWADAVVCIVTTPYVSSVWCAAEVAIAQTRGSRLLPIQAEPGLRHPLLTAVQYTATIGDGDAPRATLAEALRRIGAAGGFGWPDGRSPFPGLRPLGVEHHQVFFGRERESAELATLVRSPAERADRSVLLVVGPSGCGKSSLVRAGLTATMAVDDGWWTVPAITPGVDPVGALSRELATAARQAGLTWTIADVRRRLAKHGLAECADELLLAAPGAERQRLLLVVDQFEELFTQATAGERTRFAELLRPALAGSVQVVGTLRPEFLDLLLVDDDLATLPARIVPLRPMRREALASVIDCPAELAGIAIEDGLTARLVDDTASGEALPLLAYALAELAKGVERGGTLRHGRYEQLGAVQGALARQADIALKDAKAASGRDDADVIRELLRLVTVDEHGRPTRWRVSRDDLPEVVRTDLDAFVARRLVVTDTDDGRAVIGVAHEAFLSAWAPLREAIAASASGLRARRAVEQAADEWDEGSRLGTLLWERGRLAAALGATGGSRYLQGRFASRIGWRRASRPRCVPPTHAIELSPRAQEFLRASARRDRRLRRRATTILSVLLALAVGAAAVAVTQQQAAEKRQRLASARSLLTQAEAALSSDPATAVRLAEAALRTDPSAETRAGLVNVVVRVPFDRALDGHPGDVYAAAVAPMGGTMATAGAGGATILWDLADRARPLRLGGPLPAGTRTVYDVAFSPDGRGLATAGADGTVRLFDVTDPSRPRAAGMADIPAVVYAVAFVGSGRTVASLDERGEVTLWDVTDPARPAAVSRFAVGPITRVVSLAVVSRGTTLAAATDAGVSLWDVGDPGAPRRYADLAGLGGLVGAVAFTADGRTLATAETSTAHLWDVVDPAAPRRIGTPLADHREVINDLAFAPDGLTLASAGADGVAIVWDIRDPDRSSLLRTLPLGTSRTVFTVAFSAEGDRVVSAGSEGAALLWSIVDPTRPRPNAVPTAGAAVVAFAPDGRTLAIAGDGGTALWRVAGPGDVRRTSGPTDDGGARVTGLAFTAGGRILLTARADGSTGIWDVTDVNRPRRLRATLSDGAPIRAITATAGGPLVVTIALSGFPTIRDLSDPEQPRQVAWPLAGLPDVVSVAIAADGRTIATASPDGVTLWDVVGAASPQRIGAAFGGPAQPVTALTFAPDGRTLATAHADGTEILWSVADRARPRQLGAPLVGHVNRVGALAVSPDGTLLATASDDRTSTVWDLTDVVHPRPLGDALAGPGALSDVAFAPDGQAFVTAGGGSAVVWDLRGVNDLRGDPLTRACAMTGRGLDPVEWSRYVSDASYRDSCA